MKHDDAKPPFAGANGSAASDTPETEHALHGVWYRGDHGCAIPALCRRLERERNRLCEAIEETLRDNAHLADGDNCTLIKLKRAMTPTIKSTYSGRKRRESRK